MPSASSKNIITKKEDDVVHCPCKMHARQHPIHLSRLSSLSSVVATSSGAAQCEGSSRMRWHTGKKPEPSSDSTQALHSVHRIPIPVSPSRASQPLTAVIIISRIAIYNGFGPPSFVSLCRHRRRTGRDGKGSRL